MTFRPPRLLRLPPPEAAQRSAALFEQAEAEWTGPRLRRWWGRPVQGIGLSLSSDQPLEVAEARTPQAREAAADFYRAELSSVPPDADFWTVHLRRQLVMAAPVWRENGTPLLWPAVAPPESGELDETSQRYLRDSLISLRLWPPHEAYRSAPFSSEVALALTLAGSSDERSLQEAGFPSRQ